MVEVLACVLGVLCDHPTKCFVEGSGQRVRILFSLESIVD